MQSRLAPFLWGTKRRLLSLNLLALGLRDVHRKQPFARQGHGEKLVPNRSCVQPLHVPIMLAFLRSLDWVFAQVASISLPAGGAFPA